MTIVFLQQKNFQRSLLIAFIFIVIITLIIIWQSVFKKQTALPTETALIPEKEIKIDFNKLIGQDLTELVPFPEIEPFKEIPASTTETGEKIPGVSIGRENPFLPY